MPPEPGRHEAPKPHNPNRTLRLTAVLGLAGALAVTALSQFGDSDPGNPVPAVASSTTVDSLSPSPTETSSSDTTESTLGIDESDPKYVDMHNVYLQFNAEFINTCTFGNEKIVQIEAPSDSGEAGLIPAISLSFTQEATDSNKLFNARNDDDKKVKDAEGNDIWVEWRTTLSAESTQSYEEPASKPLVRGTEDQPAPGYDGNLNTTDGTEFEVVIPLLKSDMKGIRRVKLSNNARITFRHDGIDKNLPAEMKDDSQPCGMVTVEFDGKGNAEITDVERPVEPDMSNWEDEG